MPLYSVSGTRGSYEREFYDMIRSAFLKYIFQTRIGQMDGIFVAYHNTRSIFGFEYIEREEMEACIFETPEMADAAFEVCTSMYRLLLEKLVTCSKDGHFLKVLVKTTQPRKRDKACSLSERMDIFVEIIPLEAEGSLNEPEPRPTDSVEKSSEPIPIRPEDIKNEVRRFSLRFATQIDGMTTKGPLLIQDGDELSVFYLLQESKTDVIQRYCALLNNYDKAD